MQIKQSFLLLVHKSTDCFFPTPQLSQNFTSAVSARKFGVTFDNNKTFRQHITQTCRCYFYHIHDLRRIRRYMYFAVAKTIVTAVVSSILDYCNSIYHNIVLNDILKLQRVQNCLARVVTRSLRFSHSVPLLKPFISHSFKDLHIYLSITFIQATSIFTFAAHSWRQPRQPRSFNSNLLFVPSDKCRN